MGSFYKFVFILVFFSLSALGMENNKFNDQNPAVRKVNILSNVTELEAIIPKGIDHLSQNEVIVEQLIIWSQAYNVDLYVMSKPFDNGFFYNNLHLLDEDSLMDAVGCHPDDPNFQGELNKFEVITEFSGWGIDLTFKNKTGSTSNKVKHVDFLDTENGIRKHSVCCYNYKPEKPYVAEDATKYVKSLTSPEGKSLLTSFPLEYLKNIWIGLSWLPENIHNSLRHKSFYFSLSVGTSITISGSFDYQSKNYLGLTSGVFMQDNDNSPDLIRNTIVHEIGHLIDNAALCSEYKSGTTRARKYYWQYPGFQKLLGERVTLFKGTGQQQSVPDYYVSNATGFLTGKSEQNTDEDFADHFCAFIFERCIHASLYDKILAPSNAIIPSKILDSQDQGWFFHKSESESGILKEKYNFFNKMMALQDNGNLIAVYKIKNSNSGYFLNSWGDDTGQGSASMEKDVSDSDGGASHRFWYIEHKNGYCKFQNVYSGNFLNGWGNATGKWSVSMENDVPDSHGSANHRFWYIENKNGYCKLRNVYSGNFLNGWGSDTGKGSASMEVDVPDSHGSANHRFWELIPLNF